MNSKRLHLILLVTIALVCVGLIASTVQINKMLGAEAKTLVGLKAKSQALAQEQVRLQQSKRQIQDYTELEKITKAIVPEDKSQAETVREIVNIAAANGVKLGSITFPASTLGSNVKPATPGSTPSPAPTGGGKSAALSQLQAVPSIPGVYLMPITITSDTNSPVSYNRFLEFLIDLENNRRTAQVSTITLQPDSKNPNVLTFSLSLNKYIKP